MLAFNVSKIDPKEKYWARTSVNANCNCFYYFHGVTFYSLLLNSHFLYNHRPINCNMILKTESKFWTQYTIWDTLFTLFSSTRLPDTEWFLLWQPRTTNISVFHIQTSAVENCLISKYFWVWHLQTESLIFHS